MFFLLLAILWPRQLFARLERMSATHTQCETCENFALKLLCRRPLGRGGGSSCFCGAAVQEFGLAAMARFDGFNEYIDSCKWARAHAKDALQRLKVGSQEPH